MHAQPRGFQVRMLSAAEARVQLRAWSRKESVLIPEPGTKRRGRRQDVKHQRCLTKEAERFSKRNVYCFSHSVFFFFN